MSISHDLYDDNTNWRLREPAFPLLPEDSSVIWVHNPNSDEPPFAYSLGLADRPRYGYEVAAFGLPLKLAHSLIVYVADRLARDFREPFEGLELEDDVLVDGYAARLRLVQDTGRLEGVAPGAPVWQVVVSDKWGHFPGNPHHGAGDPYVQPLP